MIRSAKLIFCSEDNHNKFYNLRDDGTTISVEYGRVGATCQTASYSSHEFDKIVRSKVKKGYKDVTHLFTEAVSGSSKVDFLDISDKFISNLINKLEAYTKKTVSTNYLVTADTVTQKQIDEAQSILNAITSVKSNKELNKYLLEVFATIPRKMKHVKDHLYSEVDDFHYSVVESILSQEQDLLDTMAQQVKQVELITTNASAKATLLDAMGIEIFNVNDDQEKMIRNKLGMLHDKYARGFKVVNKSTQKKFDAYVGKKANKKNELLWHGSRNENWMPILNTGLLIRPTNAVHTGSMFDDGVYGANKAIKSYGYTSGKNSIWARGNSNEAYMALFDFHVGNQFVLSKWESWMSRMKSSPQFKNGNYDSVYAKGGADLKNDEFIVYTPDAVTISYLVELRG